MRGRNWNCSVLPAPKQANLISRPVESIWRHVRNVSHCACGYVFKVSLLGNVSQTANFPPLLENDWYESWALIIMGVLVMQILAI